MTSELWLGGTGRGPRNADEARFWPMGHGKTVPCWKGGWIGGSIAGKKFRIPARCKRWDCNTCGPAKKVELWYRVNEGLENHWPDEEFNLLSLTYRWKRQTETKEEAIKRCGVDSAVAARLMLEPVGWRHYINRTWSALRRRYEKANKEKQDFFRVIELTKKQGVPHIHAIIRRTSDTDENWYRENWAAITKDGDPTHCADLYSKNTRSPMGLDLETTRQTVNYIFKYIAKDLDKPILKDSGLQKYSKSRSWPMATLVDESQITIRGGKTYSYKDWLRVYGRHYYYRKMIEKGDKLDDYQRDKYMALVEQKKTYEKWRDNTRLEAEWFKDYENLTWQEPDDMWTSMVEMDYQDAWRI